MITFKNIKKKCHEVVLSQQSAVHVMALVVQKVLNLCTNKIKYSSKHVCIVPFAFEN